VKLSKTYRSSKTDIVGKEIAKSSKSQKTQEQQNLAQFRFSNRLPVSPQVSHAYSPSFSNGISGESLYEAGVSISNRKPENNNNTTAKANLKDKGP
jgi:hypothetical protein